MRLNFYGIDIDTNGAPIIIDIETTFKFKLEDIAKVKDHIDTKNIDFSILKLMALDDVDEMPEKIVVVWATLINDLVGHGCGRKSLRGVDGIKELGLQLDDITFCDVLVGFSHGCLILVWMIGHRESTMH